MPASDRPKDYAPAAHLLQVLRLLEAEPGHTLLINEIADTLGVHRRTVIRYVEALVTVEDGAGRPLVRRTRDRVGAWVTLSSPPVTVAANLYQYAALVLATRVLGAGQSVLGDSADAMVGRLAVSLGGVGAAELEDRVRQAVYYAPFGPKEYDGQEDILDAVLRATLRRQVLDITYRGPTWSSARARRLEPYTLVLYRDGLYVLARDTSAAERGLRLFAVDRMETARLDPARFEVPADYDPKRELGHRLGLWSAGAPRQRVVLRIYGPAADVALERAWPGLDGITEGEGFSDVTLDVEVTPEVRSWIIGFGDAMEVLEPAGLRQEIAAIFTRAVERNR